MTTGSGMAAANMGDGVNLEECTFAHCAMFRSQAASCSSNFSRKICAFVFFFAKSAVMKSGSMGYLLALPSRPSKYARSSLMVLLFSVIASS